LGMHAARLATAGCELILARGFAGPTSDAQLARLARRAAVVSGAATQLPTWAVVTIGDGGFTADGEAADECARAALDAGAQVAMFEVPQVEVAMAWLDRLEEIAGKGALGFAPAAGSTSPEAWAADARRLLDEGVRVLGGGKGTTHRHLAALAG